MGFGVELSRLSDCSLRRQLLRVAARRTHNRADAEDILQTALLRAIEHSSQPLPQQDLAAWLGVVVRHLTSDLARQQRRRRAASELDLLRLEANVSEPPPRWHGVSAGELASAIDVLRRQHPDYAQAYELHYEKGMSYKQISALLEIPVPTVATRLHRVRKQLRAALDAAAISGCATFVGNKSGRGRHSDRGPLR